VGKPEKTLSVMLSFDAESLPDKVKVVSVSYHVRAYVTKILLCFSCHVYGHIAAVCRRDMPTCETCAGGHEMKECVVSVEKVVLVVRVIIGMEIGGVQ
jgi:hypothetical protein